MLVEVNGTNIDVDDESLSLLELLRDRLGLVSVKDGCSPQGQCGCCTVLIDGEPRVSCVTPVRRIAGRSVTTLEGLDAERRDYWGGVFCDAGASQCGFCTPGIMMRLEALTRKSTPSGAELSEGLETAAVRRALSAHLCRCTGWQTIVDVATKPVHGSTSEPGLASGGVRDLAQAERRATIEGHAPQRVSPRVALGEGGFADDRCPPDALVAIMSDSGEWVVGETMADARRVAGRVQGRNTTVEPSAPIDLPAGDWVAALRTGWVEPGYLETDASWCVPGGTPAQPLANGGAFGAKSVSPVSDVARRLADTHGRPVRVRWTREDVVRFGPKRPPIAAGVRADGSGVMRVARTPRIAERVALAAPNLIVEQVDVVGPPTSSGLRAAGWGEAAILLSAIEPDVGDGSVAITTPDGAWAHVAIRSDLVEVDVRCGEVLDETVLRSYCIGAVHMALGWVSSEGLAVSASGEVGDLTIRSFGVIGPKAMPDVDIRILSDTAAPVCGSDAVFVATAAALWRVQGRPTNWPTGLGVGLHI